ncbi:LOW QUALITY PROTEIN: uncharacterized protein LOC142597550 [Dermatophagoides farinae]|uniref:LOW QUALITY PROTEIN: uncharacterized protein LOC142597550 n=1 Tax=Dermatophagoides farinae TaxID=6954 RepID=UPI003F5D589F
MNSTPQDLNSLLENLKKFIIFTTNYRRFARNRDPEFSIDDVEKKRQKAREYKQQLEQQMKEKCQKMNRVQQIERVENELLDQKIRLQQAKMREEFDKEHHTESVTKENNDNHHNHRRSLKSPSVQSMKMRRSSSVASLINYLDINNSDNDNNDVDDDNGKQNLIERKTLSSAKLPRLESRMAGSKRCNNRTVSTQTDISLLAALFDQINTNDRNQINQISIQSSSLSAKSVHSPLNHQSDQRTKQQQEQKNPPHHHYHHHHHQRL